MARLPNRGTPDKTKSYVFPASTGRRLLTASLLAAGLVVAGTTVLHSIGVKSVADPGPLTSGHAKLQERCELCHATRRAEDLRCERCHDPNTRNEFRVEAHARFGSESAPFAPASLSSRQRASVTRLWCADCHDDHRGRAFKPAAVDDRQCTRCHRTDTPSMGRHVEFGLVRSKATPARGMKITHERHVMEALGVLLKKKVVDLTPAEKEKGLKGDLLQQACLTCHARTADQTTFESISFPRHCAACHEKDGSVGATDPFPAADVAPAERTPTPWAKLAASQITARRDKLTKTFLSHRDPWVLFNLAKIRREVDAAGTLADRAVLTARLDAPRAAQAALLARLPVGDIELRSSEVRKQIDTLARRLALPGGGERDRQALSEGLLPFDANTWSATLNALVDPPVRDGVARATARVKAEPPAPLGSADAPWRRAELLSALDAVRDRAEAESNLVLLRRVEDTRRRVMGWKPGTSGTGDLARVLAERRLEEARLADELDFRRRAAGAQEIPPVSGSERRMGLYEAEVRQRLKALALADSFAAGSLDAGARASRLSTVDAITVPCKKCHEMGVAALEPLAIDQPVMPRAFFDHKPHVRVASCGSCHGDSGKGVTASKSARDVIVPGVANCKTCHKPSETRADCATCHRFHPTNMPVRPEVRWPSTNLIAGDDSGLSERARPTGIALLTSRSATREELR